MTTERTGTIAGNGLRAAARTDPGRQREQNEDRYFLDLESGVLLVIDGVGGHAAGEVAARIAEETIQKRIERQDAPAAVRVREAITLANQQILLQAGRAPERSGMACVLTLALLEGRRAVIGHVGDTRLYRLSPDGIAKMTHDHSPVGEREDAREISETEAMQHARRNEVYRDVGSEPREPDSPEFIETIGIDLQDDWALLLCSDGLSDMLSSLEINRIVRAHAGDPAALVDALVDAANEAGGRDNITALYIEAPQFRHRDLAPRVMPPGANGGQVATAPLDELVTAASARSGPHEREAAPPAGILRSRTLFLFLGALLGFGSAAAFGIIDFRDLWTADEPAAAARTLNVGDGAPGSFARISDALGQARDGDTIRVHPGRYAEAIELRRSVQLIATEPHRAMLVPPPGGPAFASITTWAPRATVRGFRIAGSNATEHVGIRVHTGAIDIDDVLMEGALQIGLDVAGAGSTVELRASRLAKIAGVPVQVARGARANLRQNVLEAADGGRGPAILLSGGDLSLDSNVFVHFVQLIAGASAATPVPDPAYVVPPPQSPRRERAR